MNRGLIFTAGIAATLGFGALWHGPLGAGDRLATHAEKLARATLDHYEMNAVDAHLARHPLTRTMILSGPADEFQHGELVRILSEVPGVADVTWARSSREVRR